MAADIAPPEMDLEMKRTVRLSGPFSATPKKGAGRRGLGLRRSTGARRADLECVEISPDGRSLYGGTDAGYVLRWRLRFGKGEKVGVMRGHLGMVTCLRLLPRQDIVKVAPLLVVTGSADATVRLWDPREREGGVGIQVEGTCLQTLEGHGGTVTDVLCSTGYIFSSSTDNSIRVWKEVKGEGAYPGFEAYRTLAQFPSWINTLSFSSSNKVGDVGHLYSGDSDGGVVCFSPELGRGGTVNWEKAGCSYGRDGSPQVALRRVEGYGIKLVRYIGEEQLVLTLAYDNKMRVYDSKSCQLLSIVSNESGHAFSCLDWDSTHAQALLGDTFGYFCIWDAGKETVIFRKQIFKAQAIIDVKYQRDTDEVMLASPSQMEIWAINRDTDYTMISGAHSGPVIALHPGSGKARLPGDQDGTFLDFRIVSASLDNSIRVWDPYDMQCIRLLEEYSTEISSMTFIEGRNSVVTGHDDGTIRLWDLDTGSTINLRQHDNTVSCLLVAELRKNEDFILSGSYDGYVGVWDLRRNRNIKPHLVTMFEAHPDCEIFCIKHDVGKNIIITGGNDCIIKVWNALSYEPMGEHRGHAEPVTCLALESNFLFSGSEDSAICIWDTVPANAGLFFNSGTLIKKLTGHKTIVTGIDILWDTGHLVSCSLDATVRVWDYTRGQVLTVLNHTEEMCCLGLRYDVPEVLVGTVQDHILRFPLSKLLPDLRRDEGAEDEPEAAAARAAMDSLPMVDGVQDFLRTGLPNFKADAEAAHPLEPVSRGADGERRRGQLAMLENVYGGALPLKMQIEEEITGAVGRLPGLPSSRLGYDALTGNLERFTEADYLADPRDSEVTPPPMHSVMERKLGMGTSDSKQARAFL